MSYLTQLEINIRDSEMRGDGIRENGYPEGICPCCGSDDGLNEDGIPCGYCAKGIALDWGED